MKSAVVEIKIGPQIGIITLLLYQHNLIEFECKPNNMFFTDGLKRTVCCILLISQGKPDLLHAADKSYADYVKRSDPQMLKRD